MIDLPTLLLVVALLALWSYSVSLNRRLTNVEAVLDDQDEELEYFWEYQNERWQATAERFDVIDTAFAQIFHREADDSDDLS
jgi:Tfp pilus assembly protein PilE